MELVVYEVIQLWIVFEKIFKNFFAGIAYIIAIESLVQRPHTVRFTI